MPRRLARTLLLLAGASAFAAADVVTLKDGRVLEGKILEDDGQVLKIKTRKATMSLDRKEVVSVEKKATPEEEYKERVAKLDVRSASAQLDIGRWAGLHELDEEAVRHLLEAYKLDPKLAGVAEELGKRDYHLVKGVWQDPDTYYPSIGYEKFDGRWCSPGELAWRKALKEVTALGVVRDAAKAALAGANAGVKKITLKADAERANIDRIARLVAKAEPDVAAAEKRASAAQDKAKAAAEKLTALQQKEKPKEGDKPKESSAAVKDAEKAVAAANAAAEKETQALGAAKKVLADQNADKTAAEARLRGLEKEIAEAQKGNALLEADLDRAQKDLDAAAAKAEEAKAAWEKSK